jgi:hypothetical protein
MVHNREMASTGGQLRSNINRDDTDRVGMVQTLKATNRETCQYMHRVILHDGTDLSLLKSEQDKRPKMFG